MAYVSHSPIRDLRIPGVSPSLLMRSAIVAVAAAVAILALSDANTSTAPTAVPIAAAAKSDRMAPPVAVADAGAGYSVDAAGRTTTVERGAATPLSPDSPFAPAAK